MKNNTVYKLIVKKIMVYLVVVYKNTILINKC